MWGQLPLIHLKRTHGLLCRENGERGKNLATGTCRFHPNPYAKFFPRSEPMAVPGPWFARDAQPEGTALSTGRAVPVGAVGDALRLPLCVRGSAGEAGAVDGSVAVAQATAQPRR